MSYSMDNVYSAQICDKNIKSKSQAHKVRKWFLGKPGILLVSVSGIMETGKYQLLELEILYCFLSGVSYLSANLYTNNKNNNLGKVIEKEM